MHQQVSVWKAVGIVGLTAIAVVAGPHPLVKADSLWSHNGSVVRLEDSGKERRFYYHKPRPGSVVTTGTMLFEGRRDQNAYTGTAYVFSTKCGALGYPVRGAVSQDDTTIRMYGKAPRRNAECSVAGYRDDELIFTYQSRASPDAAPVREPDIEAGDVSVEEAELAAQILEASFKCAVPGISRGEAASGGQKLHIVNKLSSNIRAFQIKVTTNETIVGRMVSASDLNSRGAPVGATKNTWISEHSADYRDLARVRHHAEPNGLLSGGTAHYIRLTCRENRSCFQKCTEGLSCQKSPEMDFQVCSKDAVADILKDVGKLIAFNRKTSSR